MSKGTLTVATCQFPVSDSITDNASYIHDYMISAKENGAQLVHFSECALSGYAGTDFMSFEGFDWDTLQCHLKSIQNLAHKLGIWTIVGSSHRSENFDKPFNCLYLINDEGQLIDRYDKRFCTPGDLNYYTPGDHFVIFDINGIKCSLLICYDLRFPEIYRALKREGVECIFQSFYNARQKEPSVHTHIMRQSMQCRAATNYFWVSMCNSIAPVSPYPSCFIQPDGVIINELSFEEPSLMINTIDTRLHFYDASAPFRELAMNGILTNRDYKLHK